MSRCKMVILAEAMFEDKITITLFNFNNVNCVTVYLNGVYFLVNNDWVMIEFSDNEKAIDAHKKIYGAYNKEYRTVNLIKLQRGE